MFFFYPVKHRFFVMYRDQIGSTQQTHAFLRRDSQHMSHRPLLTVRIHIRSVHQLRQQQRFTFQCLAFHRNENISRHFKRIGTEIQIRVSIRCLFQNIKSSGKFRFHLNRCGSIHCILISRIFHFHRQYVISRFFRNQIAQIFFPANRIYLHG